MSAPTQAPADLFYFGPPDRQLFGALHEAQTYDQRDCGVVLSYPFGHEYIRAHRACRHLAQQLAHAGFPVLRFDFGGAGDSAGESDTANMAGWRDDISRAMDALCDRAGVESVCLAGLRLGASLALEAAVERPDVRALVLWEPIVTGAAYLTELAEQQRELLWRFFDDAGRLAAGSSEEYLGFPLSATLRGELESLNLLSVRPRVDHMLLVASQATAALVQLREHLTGPGGEVAYQLIPGFSAWREDVDKGLVPDQVLRGIVAWASEVLP